MLCRICSKLRIKIPEQFQMHLSGVFIVSFGHIQCIVQYINLVLLLTILNMYLPAGNMLNLTKKIAY